MLVLCFFDQLESLKKSIASMTLQKCKKVIPNVKILENFHGRTIQRKDAKVNIWSFRYRNFKGRLCIQIDKFARLKNKQDLLKVEVCF